MALIGAKADTREQQEGPLFDLVEDLRIVSNDALPNMSLTEVTGLSVLSDGSIVTAHGSESLIRVFNPNGKLATSFGRSGQGPGEFQSIQGFGSVGDSIWVDDDQSKSIHLFSRSGQFIADIPHPPLPARDASRFVSRSMVGLLPGRRTLVVEAHLVAPSRRGGAVAFDSTIYLVRDASGKTETRLLRNGNIQPVIQIGGTSIGQPLIGRVDVAIAPGGARSVLASDPSMWGGQPGQLRLTELSNASVTSRTVSLPPLRVPRNFADSFINHVVATQRNRPSPPGGLPPGFTAPPPPTTAQLDALAQQVRSQLYVPEFLPVNKQTIPGRDGSVWIKHQIEGGQSWTVVADGRMTMGVRVPAGLLVRQVSRDYVWGQMTDADGLPIILRYRVVRRG